ncbi:hypothetical protein OCU04_001132 [Sclerotinia nivalis]|uniref:Uncharacterized protein n=1 Tax=Sclerotinia nivalis TaxID=352851 RepID=A0A9X0AXI0_9HELO|nr:hypothetical protein OCU04_001132 [Sclerotinia nivalis]
MSKRHIRKRGWRRGRLPQIGARSLNYTGAEGGDQAVKKRVMKWTNEEKIIVQDVIDGHLINPETKGFSYMELDGYCVKKLAQEGYIRTEPAVDGYRRGRYGRRHRNVPADQVAMTTRFHSIEGQTQRFKAMVNAPASKLPILQGPSKDLCTIESQASCRPRTKDYYTTASHVSHQMFNHVKALQNSPYSLETKRTYQLFYGGMEGEDYEAAVAQNLQGEQYNSLELDGVHYKQNLLAAARPQVDEAIDEVTKIKKEKFGEMRPSKKPRMSKPGQATDPIEIRDSPFFKKEPESGLETNIRIVIAGLEREQQMDSEKRLYHERRAHDYWRPMGEEKKLSEEFKKSAEKKWTVLAELKKIIVK